MKYHFKVHGNEKDGFWAECLELPGCQSQGDSKAELIENLHEALDLFLSEPEDSKFVFEEPQRRLGGRNIIEITVSPSVAIANKMRSIRLLRKLTQREMCEVLGIAHLSAYQRLEDPRRANPEMKTLAKIKSVFPELKLDEVI
ncbi:hypothetical protein D3C87_111250 [compost metagenome]